MQIERAFVIFPLALFCNSFLFQLKVNVLTGDDATEFYGVGQSSYKAVQKTPPIKPPALLGS